jgi:hypothetical protein
MNSNLRNIIRWIARIWGALMAAMILFIFIGDSAADGIGPIFHLKSREMVMMAAFLVVFVGLILSWKWELWGGWMIVGGMLAFYLLDFIFSGTFPRGVTFLLIAFPGILFLFSHYASKKSEKYLQH